jgi:hypothetical protein
MSHLEQDPDPTTSEPAENEPTRAPAPPANPPADEESVEKGREQLDKVVGN